MAVTPTQRQILTNPGTQDKSQQIWDWALLKILTNVGTIQPDGLSLSFKSVEIYHSPVICNEYMLIPIRF